MIIDYDLKPTDLKSHVDALLNLSGSKIRLIEEEYDQSQGSPVFTVQGKYTTRGWTEWTQGFEYGSKILQFDATDDESFLESGRRDTVERMCVHVTHFGVHDHGFNNVSTYGNLLRLMNEGRLVESEWERNFYEFALKCSGAVQARRWTALNDKEGYIYSFNGPHSLFADTIRSCRALAVSHQLGHVFMGENDVRESLLSRLVKHAAATAMYNVYYGEGRDDYDLRGRVVHESIFNLNDGAYRCPSTQQGYSPFSTWTRGLAWIMCGFAEELEFVAGLDDSDLESCGGREQVEEMMLKAATASCDFYIGNSAADGIPYWDTGAPGLQSMGDYLQRPADPFNDYEPVDSSAAAIGAQGLLRLGDYLVSKGRDEEGNRYWQAGLTVLNSLFAEPYLSVDASHQGLILHSVYHRPNGWDFVPDNRKVPCGEASMWGDYHAREAALYLKRKIDGKETLKFF